MKIEKTIFSDVVIFTPDIFSDSRGFFTESYNYTRVMDKIGWSQHFVQDNHSFSKEKGTIRGLHFQSEPMAQAKIVRVLSGSILDIVVDIRKESSTFKKWIAVELSAENFKQIFIPAGYAHGFCTLSDNVHACYKVDQHYSPLHNRGIIWNDLDLNISWPLTTPLLSDQDRKWPTLKEYCS